MKKFLRSGYTTGACAAAGVKAALIYLTAGEAVDGVEIIALDGTPLKIPVARVEKISDGVRAEVIKFSGDDPDITNGASVFTTVRKIFGDEIIFRAGVGVGRITKAGLQLPVGEPAINPGPRRLIQNVAAEFKIGGLEVEISIPEGVELAKKTLNPILGVEGGLSIIGSTGVLRPMSEDAFKNSLMPQIDVAKAAGFDELIFVPGKIGETFAKKLGFPDGAIIQLHRLHAGGGLRAADKKNNSLRTPRQAGKSCGGSFPHAQSSCRRSPGNFGGIFCGGRFARRRSPKNSRREHRRGRRTNYFGESS